MTRVSERLALLRDTMGATPASAAVIVGRGTLKQYGYLSYLFGFVPPVKLAVGVVPVDGAPVLLVPTTSDAVFARDRVDPEIRLEVCAPSVREDVGAPLATRLQHVLDVEVAADATLATVGWDEILTVREAGALQGSLGARDVRDVTAAFRRVKAVKTSAEVTEMRVALAVCDEVLARMEEVAVRPNATTRDLVAVGRGRATELGAQEMLMFASTNGHFGGPTTLTPLADGDLVTLYAEVSTNSGFWGELSRLTGVGELPAHRRDLVDSVAELHHAFAETARAGHEVRSVVMALEEAARARGFELGPGLGHGTGVDDHDEPALRLDSTDVLVANQVVALHPLLGDPTTGEHASLCRTYLITEAGAERLGGSVDRDA